MISDEGVDILLEDLLNNYGYDFTNYTRSSLKNRVDQLIRLDNFPSFAEFRYKLKSDREYLRRFIDHITVNVTEMFRDVSFFSALRQCVLPVLARYPVIRLWHAGCSTGEEVYSMAMVLQEEGLYDKCLIYATDINSGALAKAKQGIFKLSNMKLYSENYIRSGGNEDFSKYYTAKYDYAVFDKSLKEKIIFSNHNLVNDGSFNEFQLIICRNVLIYFDPALQHRALGLFDESLEMNGFLALGSKETLLFSSIADRYEALSGREKIFQKVREDEL